MKHFLKIAVLFAAAAISSQAFAAPATTPTPTDPLSKLMAQIQGVQADVVSGVVADLAAADADASTLTVASDPTSFRDPISHACYPAMTKFIQSFPTATPTTGKMIGFQLFQKKRDFVAQLNAGLPVYLKLGCAPLLGDEIQTLNTALLMLGLKVLPAGLTAAFPALAPITLPALAIAP
jgi:hypothetical protein